MKKLFTLLLFTLLSVISLNAADVYLAGTMTEWDKNKVKMDGSSGSYSVSVNLNATTDYEFKIIYSGTWYGSGSTVKASTQQKITSDGGNCKFTTTYEGSYKFDVLSNSDGKYVTITYPEPPADPATITVTSDNELYGLVTPAEVEVNETTFATITAKPMYCCDFVTWQLGGSARLAEGNLTDASIKVKSDGTTDPGTAKAVFSLKSNTWKLTYVKTNDWSSVYAHLWGGSAGTTWTGSKLFKTSQKKLGYDIYEVMVYNDNTSVIFNCNGDACKEEKTLNSSTPVYYKGSWYASLDDIQRTVVVGGYSSDVKVDDFNLTSSDDETYTGSVYLEKDKNYQFKVKVDGTNYSLSDLVINESISDQVLYTSNGRINLNASVAGSYNFTFVFSTKKLSVEFPEPPADPATITVTSADANQGTVSPAQVQVNASQSAQITATPAGGYIFDKWTLGGSAVIDDGYALTDATIKVKSDGTTDPGSAVASFKVDPNLVTLYLLNTANWSNKYAYVWYNDGSDHPFKSWSGEAMTKTNIEITSGKFLYSYTFPNQYTKIIFSNQGSSQTANLNVADGIGKYWDNQQSKWVVNEPTKSVAVTSANVEQGTVSPAQVSVGDVTTAQITATGINGYKISTWTLTNCTTDDPLTNATITIKSDGTDTPGTAVASFEIDPDAKILYFVNSVKWDTPYIHIWTPDVHSWPGTAMTKTAETATSEEFEVWSFSFTPLATQTNCKFNCGGDACQKGNFTIDYEHPYYYPYNNTWYATLDEIPDPEYMTFRYVNVNNWDYVNFHYWNGSEYSSWPGELMTKEDDKFLGFDVWTITKIKGTFSSCKFNCGDSKQTGDLTVTDGKYCYYKSGWYATLEEIVPALAGTFNSWSATANQFVFDENQVGTTTLTLEANAKPEFKVIDGAMYGNNNTMTHDNCTDWTMHQSQGNCKIQARNKGEFTFTYDLKTNTLSATYPEYTDAIDMIVTNASGETTIPMTKNPQADKEYYKYGQVLRTGDVVTFYDHYGLKSFKAKAIDPSGSMTNVAEITDNGLEITQSIETNFYLILESGNDKVQLQHGSKILDEIAPNAFLSEIDGKTQNLMVIRPLSSACYNTLCLPFDLDEGQIETYFNGAEIAELTYAEVEKVGDKYKTYLRFTRVKSIKAGMPYVIQPASDVSAEPITFANVTISKTSHTKQGDLVDAVGILVPTELKKDAYNYLFLGAANKLFYPSETGNMKAMRSYFYVKPDAPKTLLKGYTPAQLKSIPAEFSIEDPDDEVLTEVLDAEAENAAKAYKMFNDNNEIIIVIDGKQFNLAGQPIK